jgi:hypothetical protein
MLSQVARLILTSALLCAFAFLVAVTPLRSQTDVASVQKMAESGDIQSQDELAIWYANGIHVTKDNTLAMKWWTKAAEQGDRFSQGALGVRYLHGYGVAQDYALSRFWFQKAADQGDPMAPDYLGEIYSNGYGVPKDYALARALYQKAANLGNAAAYLHMGDMYARGLGVPQDNIRAKDFYQKAAEIYTPANWAYAKDDGDRLKALKSAQQPSCDPNWSSKLNSLTSDPDGFKTAIQQQLDGLISKYGGLDGAITENEREIESAKDQLAQHQSSGDEEGVNKLQAVVSMNEGLIDILRCRQSMSARTTGSPVLGSGNPQTPAVLNQSVQAQVPQNSSSPQAPAQVDVRYLPVDSRPLTDAEMRDLRNTLRWDPESVPLTPGGAARSNLLDSKGRTLGSVLVRWDKPATSRTEQALGSARRHFTIQVENGTSCVFLSSAEIDDSQGFIVVSGVTWSGWLTLHQPDRGQTSQARGDAALTQTYPSLVLKPLTAHSTLTACMTPKNP